MNDFIIRNLNAELLKEAIGKNSCIWVKVKGKSMFPIFVDNSLVRVSSCPIEDIGSGYIAVFKEGDGIICHRVIKKIKSKARLSLITKSDITFYGDALVEQDMLLGKVIALKKLGLTIRIDNIAIRLLGLFLGYLLPIFISPIFYLKSFIIKYGILDKT